MAQQISKGLSCLLASTPTFSSSAQYSSHSIYVSDVHNLHIAIEDFESSVSAW